ncbi:MAG TPA: hypothetical protein VFZ75_13145 [Actinomycetota bacterium]|nr:hypothetical protein [Actinomycetota bacterium]
MPEEVADAGRTEARVCVLRVRELIRRGSLAGAERLSDRESQRFEDYLGEQGERFGVDVEGGVYGGALGPEFFVILLDAAAVETTDQLFDALLLGFS